MHIYIYMHVYMYVYIYVYVCISIRTYVHIPAHLYVQINIYIYIFMGAYMHTFFSGDGFHNIQPRVLRSWPPVIFQEVPNDLSRDDVSSEVLIRGEARVQGIRASA